MKHLASVSALGAHGIASVHRSAGPLARTAIAHWLSNSLHTL